MVVRIHRLSQTFGIRLGDLPYIAIFGPKAWAWAKIPGADYFNLPLCNGWRFVIRR